MSNGPKPITMADLNSALKPLIELLNKIKEEMSGFNTSQNEIHQMLTSISVATDVHEQTIHSAVTDAVGKVAIKKLAGKGRAATKKTTTKKPPVKRGTKKATEDETTAEEPEENTEDAAEPTEDSQGDEQDESETKKATKKVVTKKTVAKLPTKKATTKKATTKKAAAEKPKTKQNIMSIFNAAFSEDESQFKCINAKSKKEIEATNKEAWKELEGDALTKARSKVYYEYIRDNHKQVLVDLKASFIAKQAETDGDDGTGEADEADE